MGTEIFNNINWLTVIVAGAAYFFLGAIWYTILFGKLWIKSSGVNVNNPDAKKGAGAIMVFTFILELIASLGLAIIISKLMLSGAMSGIKLGLLTGVCFAAVGIHVSYLYQSKPRSLHFIDAGYHIVGNIIAAVILCLWQ
jgi:hypothetical protein